MNCGVLFSNYGPIPHDKRGCSLELGHSGPHEFVATCGKKFQWKSDLECDRCDEDQCDGDWCSIYWEVKP